MKIRNGFVSNSSSSSFICAVCGGDESGWDLCLSEAEMFECGGCGNTIHISCAKVSEELKEDFSEALNDDCYETDSKFCPICQLIILTNEDEMDYYRMKHGFTNKVALEEIKEEFGSFEKFIEAHKKWKKSEKMEEK